MGGWGAQCGVWEAVRPQQMTAARLMVVQSKASSKSTDSKKGVSYALRLYLEFILTLNARS